MPTKTIPSNTERIVLKDMTCPIIRLDQSRRRDKSVSFSISLCLHAVIFILVGVSFIKPPEFGVDRGLSGIEVSLVAAPEEEVVPLEPIEPLAEPIKSDFVEKQIPKQEAKPVEKPTPSETKGKDHVSAQSTGGAISEAKPDYLKNPAPRYPESARRRGFQGTVLLRADINKEGNPVNVTIEKSSGHRILDEAALKAVKEWKFQPGKLGDIPVDSTVRVPVKFDLKES